MNELLPCPFCGSEPEIVGRETGAAGQVRCANEDCFGPRTTAVWKEDSIRQWNTRAGDARCDAQIAAMVNAMRDEHFRLKGFHPYTADLESMLRAALQAPLASVQAAPACGGVITALRRIAQYPNPGSSDEDAPHMAKIAEEALGLLARSSTGIVEPGK